MSGRCIYILQWYFIIIDDNSQYCILTMWLWSDIFHCQFTVFYQPQLTNTLFWWWNDYLNRIKTLDSQHGCQYYIFLVLPVLSTILHCNIWSHCSCRYLIKVPIFLIPKMPHYFIKQTFYQGCSNQTKWVAFSPGFHWNHPRGYFHQKMKF